MTVAISVAVGTRAPRRSSAPRPATPPPRWRRTPPGPGSSRSCWCPQGKIAAGKLAQAIVHGAQVIMVRGNFDDCLRHRARASPRTTRWRWSTRSTRSASRARRPRRSRSSTSSATPPTSTCCRSATPATSRRTGWATASTPTPAAPPGSPRMRGFQAAGAAPLVTGAPVADPETGRHRDPDRQPRLVARSPWRRPRRVRRPVPRGHRRRRSSPRSASSPRRDGVFVEPASAAGVAGLLRRARGGATSYAGRTVVVTVTGHGLKDIDTALSTFTDLVDTVVDADVDAAAAAAGLA